MTFRRKPPRCSANGCRNRSLPEDTYCSAHRSLLEANETMMQRELVSYHRGVQDAARQALDLSRKFSTIPKHVLVQEAQSWMEGPIR